MDETARGSQDDLKIPVAHVASTGSSGKSAGKVASRLWIVTALCLVVALLLVWAQLRSQGPRIKIDFSAGHGLEPGDPVRYRGIDVGKVRRVTLKDELDGVLVEVQLSREADALAREGTRFWIARAEIRVGQVRGLETLLGGRYVGVVPGPAEAPRATTFLGIEDAPESMFDFGEGVEIVLEGPHRRGLEQGSPVTYRGIRVGHVMSVGLANDSTTIVARAFVQPQYRSLICEGTRFWTSSGFGVRLGLQGVELNAETLSTIAAGGVALATPDPPGRAVTTGHRFELFEVPQEEWLEWRPRVAVGSAALPTDAPTPQPVLAVRRGQGRVFGLLGGKQHRGWLLALDDGRLLGPAALLEAASGGDHTLELAGQQVPLTADGTNIHGPLATRRLPKNLENGTIAWPVSRIRTPAEPEQCVVTCGSDNMTMPLSPERISVGEAGWMIEPSLPFDDDWHGAPVIASRDGFLVGFLIRSDGRSQLVPIANDLLNP
jgi:hypothetical protein